MITYFNKELKSLKDLFPSESTNSIFNKLYTYCVEKKNDSIKITKEVEEINIICWNAEYEMEKYYAQNIINSNIANRALEDFIYYKNYSDLTQLEYLNMSFFHKNIKHILFLWSGPLPLSALLLAQKFGIHFTLVDISQEALEISKELIYKFNLENLFQFVQADVKDFRSDRTYDFVIWASLLFQNDSKNQENILQNIQENINFSYLLVRSSSWIRQLLYKKIPKFLLKKYFKILLEIHPKNELINSIIILQKYEISI